MNPTKYWSTIIGLTLGNFIYQWITNQNYEIALERSFFQGGAIFTLWLINHWD